MWKLEIMKGDAVLKEIALSDDRLLTLGRLPDNDVQFPEDESVSRHHARIRVTNGTVTLEDLQSHFGTFVGGRKITAPTSLRDGDEVCLAGQRLRVVNDDPATLQPTETGVDLYAEAGFQDLLADIHRRILNRINAEMAGNAPSLGTNANLARDGDLAKRAQKHLDDVLLEVQHRLPYNVSLEEIKQFVIDELLGYGPISPLLRNPDVTEIMVNGPKRVFYESEGLLHESNAAFRDGAHLVQIIQRIVEPLGRHIDDSSPMVDARLPDGSRVNAVIPPLALDGASMTVRKFAQRKLTTGDLIKFGSLTSPMARFLELAVQQRQNILVSGGTGSGKTTLLNILSQFIPEGERLVTIEDSAELKLSHRNIVRMEARPANIEGKGRITIRDLVVNSLRMRPDRVIVGECRGAEALDMLQAMNTGHDGSLTTAHANNPRDALSRLENMVMMAGFALPSSAIREQIASAINIIVQQSRMSDGSRKIVKIVEITGRENDAILMQDIFEFKKTGYESDGRVRGYYTWTGSIPHFVQQLMDQGKSVDLAETFGEIR